MHQLYIAAVIISLAAVLFWESLSPLHSTPTVPLARWLHNLALSVLALGASLLAPLLFWSVTRMLGVQPSGGWQARWSVPLWGQWLAAFLVLDGMAYALHRLSHAVPWLWRLHAVHHSDVELDATTAHRHHPLENLLISLLTLPVLVLLAPPVMAVLVYSLLAVAVSTVAHGNLRLPAALDRGLRRIVVTPAYHRMHHSREQPQTDSNYATVFPWFDYLLGSASAVPVDGGRATTMGLEYHREPASQTLPALLLAPFRPLR
ncbi:MAG: sterol desaturase family protein [Comamonas sp.]